MKNLKNILSEKKELLGVVGLFVLGVLAVGVLAFSAVKAYTGQSSVVVENLTVQGNYVVEAPEGSLGAFTTVGTNFTDVAISGDLTVGGAQTLSGALATAGLVSTAGLTSSGGDARIGSLISTGSTTTLTSSATDMTVNLITAAHICDYSEVVLTPGNTTTPTWYLPATGTLFADCLTTDGDSAVLSLYNSSSTLGATIAAGSGGTIYTSSSTIIYGQDMADLKIIRDTANAYRVLMGIFK